MKKDQLRYLALPLLIAAYPVLFLYGRNAVLLDLETLILPLGASLLVALGVYALFLLLWRKSWAASLSAALFMLVYFLYGVIFRQSGRLLKVQVQHEVLLPLLAILVVIIGFFIRRMRSNLGEGLQKGGVFVAGALVLLNVGMTLPVVLQKIPMPNQKVSAMVPITTNGKNRPDIYYLIFDEYAGSEAIQGYWHEDYESQLENFLRENGFFVATASRSPTINTGAEIASRLNFHLYSDKTPDTEKIKLINDNKVMQLMKAYGYQTVAMSMYFQNIKADFTFKIDRKNVGGTAAGEFKQAFFDYTMFNAFQSAFQFSDQSALKQRDNIFFYLNKTANLQDIPSPKFVFTHILVPHEPFIFDENGNLLPPKANDDWGYYLGQHKYATKLIQQEISAILAHSDPANPPVIILQSDHGARNLLRKTKDGVILNGYLHNYDAKYMYMVLNAVYMPGYDTSKLANDMPPISALVTALNYYLDANVKVDNLPETKK